MKPITHLLYLHGFRSSPQSTKARQTLDWLSKHHPEVVVACPQLPASPAAAVALAESLMARESGSGVEWGVIGSSLGGFYASVLAGRHRCRVVLLNPAVNPARDLAAHIGETTAFHSAERIHFKAWHVAELEALAPAAAVDVPERCFAIIAKGDEVLDWREMHSRHADCRLELLEGGDHALSDYAKSHLGKVMGFLGLGHR